MVPILVPPALVAVGPVVLGTAALGAAGSAAEGLPVWATAASENLNVLRGSLKRNFGENTAAAFWKVKSPAAPGGNMSLVKGTAADVIVSRRSGLYAQ